MKFEELKSIAEHYCRTNPERPEEGYLIVLKRLCQLAIELAGVKHTEPLDEPFIIEIYKELANLQEPYPAYLKVIKIINNDESIQLSSPEEIINLLSK